MLLRIYQLSICLILFWRPVSTDDAYCDMGGGCSNQKLMSIIIALQDEARQAERQVINDYQNCTACFSSPCQNGGTCIPDGNHYRCDCPQNTNGTKCETVIECHNNSCGPNANCFVTNHQISCVCKLGFAGDDPYYAGCPLKVVQSCFTGDPHFVTFDKLSFGYQGTCPFIVSEPCSSIPGYPTFSVRAVNTRWQNISSYVARVASAQLLTYDTTVQVNRDRSELLINGVPTTMPYYLGNATNWHIHVYQTVNQQQQKTAFIETDYNLKIEFGFDSSRFCLTVPDIPAFRGQEVLCGLTGNLDGDCNNDLRLRNGTVLPVVPLAPCAMDQLSMISEEFGDGWIVPHQDHGCILGTVMANRTLPCDAQYFTDAGVLCQPILDALNAVNYFAQCQGMGAAEINRYYRSCQWEICVQNKTENTQSMKCTMLTEFAHACQRALPGTHLGEWRTGLTCPIYCPSQSSVYNDCATGCPETCAVHDVPANCTQPCIEGCACKPGYVFDNGTCIALGNCSCFDGNRTHGANSVWYEQNCTIRKECHDGIISSQPSVCDSNAICAISGGQEQCVCKVGFAGDGVRCADINECLNTTLCGQAQGQGWCNNTIGSYFCTCNPNFDGQECQRFHPRRHCADLYVVHNDTTSGIKTIYPSFAYNGRAANTALTVYCDMVDGGGWTAFTGPDGNSTVEKTFAEYVNGFGDVNANDYWLGLSYLYGATHDLPTSLRVSLEFCNGEKSAEWIYPEFSILNATSGYAPVISSPGSGSAGEGWMMNWPNGQGPRFSGVDNCQKVATNSATTCCSIHGNTGWWFDDYMCGMANLNGIRFSCEYLSANPNTEQSIIWNFNRRPKSATMLLRPKDYPNYSH